MEAAVTSAPNTTIINSEISDNTITFIIGFSILILFVILGVLASAFLCLTLKKDPFLWESGRDKPYLGQDEPTEVQDKIGDKLAMIDEVHNLESTEI